MAEDSANFKIERLGGFSSMDLSSKHRLEHFPPNQFHVETGIFLLWWILDGEKVDLIDWELYSKNPSRGQSEKEAFARIFNEAARQCGQVVL